jgi:hypothetical protein
MSWSSRRQFRVLGIILALILIFISIPIYKKIHVAPSCMDQKQNGDERGVDCGGSCKNFCANEVVGLSVKWARAFKTGEGVYNAIAYIENQNKTAAARQIGYEFKLYDSDRRLIGRKEGTTFVSPNGVQPIIETGIRLGNAVPQFTTFTVTKDPVWIELDPLVKALSVTVSTPVFTNTNRARLVATSKNQSPKYEISDVSYIAILYDAKRQCNRSI